MIEKINLKKKYILYYVVSEKHIENFSKIKSFFQEYEFIVVYDSVLKNNRLVKNNKNFILLDKDLLNFININST